jgi:hypothetical protein
MNRQTFENMWRSTGITREQFIERIKQRILLNLKPLAIVAVLMLFALASLVIN